MESSQRLSVSMRLPLPSAFMMKICPYCWKVAALVAEAVHAAAPHNPAVRGPDCVTVVGSARGEPQKVGAVRSDRVDVEIDHIHATREQDSAAVGRPAGQVVVFGGQDARARRELPFA